MVAELFEVISEVMSSYVTAITSMFTSLINIFYVDGTGFTLLGILVLIGFGIGIVKWGFNLVKGLVRL